MSTKINSREPKKTTICPHCKKEIRFYNFSGMGEFAPHFYCDTCSNVFFRKSDAKLISYDKKLTEELLEEISRSLPSCPCGGHFKVGANPKCPNCHKELPHQYNSLLRLTDPYAILVEGAILVTED
jgi:hypothetical protein